MTETTADFLAGYLDARRALVEDALLAHLPQGHPTPETLREAMAYPVAAGGKRLRPVLALAGAEAMGAAPSAAIEAAVAVEYIHTYSLVHDDLPAMDDDDLRRGKPTTHKVWDEAIAILVGDALLTQAFEVLASPALSERIGAARTVRLVREVARAAGAPGMVGGQVIDIESEGRRIDADRLALLHRLKTGALLRVSVVAGGICAGADDEQLGRLATYGEHIGLAFQIVDDILDVTATTEALGKPQGSDARHDKSTFVSLYGLDESRRRAADLIAGAHEALRPFGDAARPLAALADYVVNRTH